MDKPLIEFTGTISAVLTELKSSRKVHAADVVRKILEHHQEYASGTAREVAGASWPGFEEEESKSAIEWISQVRDLFDPLLVDALHGRLAILGLCKLDKTLGKHLRSFTTELKKELLEDFDSLLLPEYAGDQQYRRAFLKILQNRGKYEGDPEFDKRETGFLIMTHGGERLDVLNGLCFQQRYNSCLTARYQVLGNGGLTDFLRMFSADIEGIPRGDFGTVGKYLPELNRGQLPGQNRMTWRGAAPSLLLPDFSSDGKTPFQMILGNLFALLYSAELPVGQRLVLFLEWRGLSSDVDSDSIGLTDEVVAQLSSMQERVGVVISGLPDSVRSKISGRTVYQLEVPADEEPKRSQKLENDTPSGPDRLNIVDEVQALADAIVLKEMEPPLVVGVFGGWGSGKSFVLHLIEERIHERRCEGIAAGDDAFRNYPFVGHPYLVHFDAWTYAKGNLWASLMQTTLVELDRQLSLERELGKRQGFDWRAPSPIWKLLWQLSDQQREVFSKTELGREALEQANVFEDSGATGRLWVELENLRSTERKRLDKEEEDLRQLREEQAVASRELEAEVDKELSADARWIAWAPVWDEINALAGNKLNESDAPTFDKIVKAVPAGRKLLLGVRNLSLPAATFMIVALVGGFVMAGLDDVFVWYGQIGGALVAMGAPVLRAWDWFEKRRNAYEQRLAIAQEGKDKLRQQRIDERLQIGGENSNGANVADLNAQVGEKEAAVERIRKRIGITGQARSLNDFLKTRIGEGLYQKELGLLDQIQNDIQELSDTLLPGRARGTLDRKSTKQLFPRGDPRVVLLIDDLDRCPPDKVVEVLEAAQLLVKTQLFVVVIAIDVRYVTRALEAEYKDVLVRSGEPSGLDYIEKIIQIPYRVRSVSAPGIRRFLRAQMDIIEPEESDTPDDADDPAASATQIESADSADEQAEKARLATTALATHTESINLPSDAIQFQPEEYAAISASCSALAVSPRTMKRLVNVFKLLKIIWYRQGLEDGPLNDVKKAMLSILALCARYPEVLRKLLAEMESFFRAEQSDLQKPIVDFAREICADGAKIALYPPDWEQVADAINDAKFFPADLTFSRLGEANLHLLSSFSFVGETDSEREATLQRGYYRNSDGGTENNNAGQDPPP